jgi:hypothetical protein
MVCPALMSSAFCNALAGKLNTSSEETPYRWLIPLSVSPGWTL